MNDAKRLRIYVCLNELVKLAEMEAFGAYVTPRIVKLTSNSDWKEMKEWLEGKK